MAEPTVLLSSLTTAGPPGPPPEPLHHSLPLPTGPVASPPGTIVAAPLPVAEIESLLGQPDSASRYVMVRQIGGGSYGTVFLVKRRTDGDLFVAKIMELAGVNERKRQYALSELQCHAQLNHFAIARQVEGCITPSGDRTLTIVELGEAGDLSRITKSRSQAKEFFAEHEIAFLFLQLVLALDSMHRLRMLHRDIKAANVFVKSNGLLKLGDFGFSRQFDDTVSDDVAQSFCGTPSYVAPELWRREKYSKKADIWSLGVLVYEITALRRPFSAETMALLAESVCRGSFPRIPAMYSDGLQDIIARMLALQPHHRPSTIQILAHPYMILTIKAFIDAIRQQVGIEPPLQQVILSSVAEVQAEAEALHAQLVSGLVPVTKVGSQGDSRPSALSSRSGYLLAGNLYKLTAEGWRLRLVSLSPTSIVVENTDGVVLRKELHLKNVSDVRPVELREHLVQRGESPVPPAVIALRDFGVEVEVFSGKRIVFACNSAEDQGEWVRATLQAVQACT